MSAPTPETAEPAGAVSGPDHGAPGAHLAEVTERGSFAFAVCSCGWFAPARRSRDRARRDVAEHLDDPELP